MNKKNVFAAILFAAGMVSSAIIAMQNSEHQASEIVLNEIEAISDCERVDGNEDDGMCVQDDYLHYFCASPVAGKTPDCLQRKD